MNETKSKEVFSVYEKLKSLQSVSKGVDLELAKELAYMKEEENYKIIMGDDEASWKAFLAQPEINIHVAKADRLIKIFDTYIIKLGLSEEAILGVDSNSLARLSSVVNKKNVNSWIDKAKALSRADLYREIKFGHVDEMKCEHTFKSKKVSICSLCGTREVEKLK